MFAVWWSASRDRVSPVQSSVLHVTSRFHLQVSACHNIGLSPAGVVPSLLFRAVAEGDPRRSAPLDRVLRTLRQDWNIPDVSILFLGADNVTLLIMPSSNKPKKIV